MRIHELQAQIEHARRLGDFIEAGRLKAELRELRRKAGYVDDELPDVFREVFGNDVFDNIFNETNNL